MTGFIETNLMVQTEIVKLVAGNTGHSEANHGVEDEGANAAPTAFV